MANTPKPVEGKHNVLLPVPVSIIELADRVVLNTNGTTQYLIPATVVAKLVRSVQQGSDIDMLLVQHRRAAKKPKTLSTAQRTSRSKVLLSMLKQGALMSVPVIGQDGVTLEEAEATLRAVKPSRKTANK